MQAGKCITLIEAINKGKTELKNFSKKNLDVKRFERVDSQLKTQTDQQKKKSNKISPKKELDKIKIYWRRIGKKNNKRT